MPPGISIPTDDEQQEDPQEILRRIGANAQQMPSLVAPEAKSPVLVNHSGKAIPTGRIAGIPGYVDPVGQNVPRGTSVPAGHYNPANPVAVSQLWNKAENINNPTLRVLGKIGAGLARGIDVAGSIAAPGIAAQIPGSTLNEKMGENRALKQATIGSENSERAAQTANLQSETEARPAETAYKEAQTEALENPPLKPKEEQWEVAPNFQGPNGEPILLEKNSGQYKLATSVPGIKPRTEQKPDNPEQQFVDEYQRTNPGATIAQAQRAHVLNQQAPQQPERPQRVLGVGPDHKVFEITPGMTIPDGTKMVTGELAGNKPTADEQRRADLAENLNENLAALEDIVNRKPNLFGPLAGRMTEAQSFLGTSDPDIAALNTIKHQIGMAQISAHGMRSAHGIDSAAESILNSFHNSPEAVKGAINAARNSVRTFQSDVDRAKTGGTQTETAGEPARPANVPQGYVFKANGPKGRGWYKP